MSVSTKLTTQPTAANRRSVGVPAMPVSTSAGRAHPAQVTPGAVAEFKDRRRRRRVLVPAMYTSVVVRLLNQRGEPLDGHVLNLSETGMSVQLDDILAPGQPLAIEFTIAGLGMFRNGSWPTFALTAEVIRTDDVDDYPQGPYKTALRFERVPTIVQAQIARFIMNTPPAK